MPTWEGTPSRPGPARPWITSSVHLEDLRETSPPARVTRPPVRPVVVGMGILVAAEVASSCDDTPRTLASETVNPDSAIHVAWLVESEARRAAGSGCSTRCARPKSTGPSTRSRRARRDWTSTPTSSRAWLLTTGCRSRRGPGLQDQLRATSHESFKASSTSWLWGRDLAPDSEKRPDCLAAVGRFSKVLPNRRILEDQGRGPGFAYPLGAVVLPIVTRDPHTGALTHASAWRTATTLCEQDNNGSGLPKRRWAA